LLVVGCRTPSSSELDAQASPQALATPAPLSSTPAATASTLQASLDAGPPPSSLRFDRALAPDLAFAKETTGYTIEASFRAIDMPVVPKGPDIATSTIEALRKKTEPHLSIDLGAGRVRAIVSGGFVIPAGTELRARSDRYGQLLVSQGGSSYHVLEPGVLRALLGERRFDASPLSGAEVSPKGEGHRLGMRTRKVDLTTRAGKGSFELVKLADAGDSGVVLARMLASLLDAPPSTTIAVEGEVPVRLELVWATATHGGALYEATSVTRRTDLGARELAVPPPGASLATSNLPAHTSEMLISPAEAATIHNGPSSADARGTLILTNGTDETRFAWLDGVPVAWLAPRGRIELPSLPKGHYQLVWRSFFGDVVDPPRTVDVPGAIDASGADAGAP
jgi:hypothetical protein